MEVKRFQKIHQLGTRYTHGIFEGPVEITEKIDGSQFGFGLLEGKLICRSRGNYLNLENPEKMFKKGVDYIKSIQDKLPNNVSFYAEYLAKPKHNALAYERVPKNHFALYAIKKDGIFLKRKELHFWADALEIDAVPILGFGTIDTPESIADLNQLLDRESYLGGQKIEGFVIKNYNKSFVIDDIIYTIMCAKVVSDTFKERNHKSPKQGKDLFLAFCESFRTEARWEKALIHLQEGGLIKNQSKDIGLLIKETHKDILEEHEEEIKEFLFKHFSKQVLKTSTNGLPEWYQNKLMEGMTL